jgi:eukaryotic-like serine/threonine-protein kinase
MRAISKIDNGLDRPLGRYQLIALLGQGGMADVYLACTQGPGGFQKLLVVKLARFTGDAMLSTMFLDEAKLAAQLSHPNVVQTFEVGDEGSRHYIVMEYLDGANFSRLRQRAMTIGGIPLRISVQILCQVLEGLEYAHQARGIDGKVLRVVHRDLTPSNIIVTSQGVVKILDFGIAKAADSHSFTQAGRYSGKLAYMPPEQVRGERVDERADIFSVGVILAEAVLGVRFWGNASEPMVASRLVVGELPSLERAPYVDPELRRICERALAPAREHRYPNAATFKAELQRFLQALGGAVPREELAEFVESMTREDRARLQAIMERQLSHVGALPSGSDVPPLDLPRVEVTPAVPGSIHAAATVRHDSVRTGSQRPQPPTLGFEVPSLAVEVSAPPAPLSASTPSQGALGARRRVAAIVLAGSAAAGAAFAGAMLFRQPVNEPAATAAAPAAVALRAPVTTPEPEHAAARLEIVVSPPEAKLELDGRPLGGNPYVGAFPLDGKIHELLVTADGFAPVNQRFTLDRDLMLQLRLQAKEEAPEPTRRPIAASRPPLSASRHEASQVREHPVAAPREPAPVAEPPAAGEASVAPTPPPRDAKRGLDEEVFDSKPAKRALDSNVYDNGHSKADIDRDTPWKK